MEYVLFKSFDIGVPIVHNMTFHHFANMIIPLALCCCFCWGCFYVDDIGSDVCGTTWRGNNFVVVIVGGDVGPRMLLFLAQYRVGAMLFSLLITRLPSFLWLLYFDVGGGDVCGTTWRGSGPLIPPPALVWWSAQLRKRRCRADLQRTMQRWWNYAKGNWEESPLSLIEDPCLRPQAHFFRRLLNLGSSNLRDQNRGNEGKTRNAIGMLWPLQPLVSHYSKLLIVLHCKPSLNGCR